MSQDYFVLNNMLNIPVNGQIPLHYDQEALENFLKNEIEPHTKKFVNITDKLTYLVKNNYVDEAVFKAYLDAHEEGYINDFIIQAFSRAYDFGFSFKSFMASYKFYNQYAMKTNDLKHYLETFEDRIVLNALYLGAGDKQLALDLIDELISQRYQPATPTFLNAGKKRRGEMVSCFLIDMDDSMLSIGRGVNSSLQLSRIGGGVGVNLSNLRATGSPIKGIEHASSGVLPVMKLLEDSFSYSNQLGQRNGAGVVYLNVFHQDILEFLSTKKENTDEKIRIKTLSLGLVVPDKYYELLKTNAPMYLFNPYHVERIYNEPFSYVDLTEEYDNMVNNPEIDKTIINARELEQEISRLQQESGYPYILNVDTANRTNPVPGKIIMSNLCSEILQPQEPSKLNADLSYDAIGTDISCNLGSMNMVNLMKGPNFAYSIDLAIRALTTVTDSVDIKEVPSVSRGNSLYHTIGLGVMGLHTFLATNGIAYDSEEAIEVVDAFFLAMNYYSLKSSNKIAKEKFEVFHDFDKSKYADGTYFDKYLLEEFEFSSPKVAGLFKNIALPSIEDWENLRSNVMIDGLYHRNRLAIAPNGSISYINETSASLHPITQLIENRQEKKVGSIFYPAPYLSNKTIEFYKTAYDMDQRKIIDIYATAQKHIDQGMSLTLFMRSKLPDGLYEWKKPNNLNLTTRDLNRLRNYAWTKGIKSLYYVRTYTEDDEFESVNSCESCMV
ncbi:class 1b ribonucleoside-diphosphate reductase subunit alpha [Lactococcus cremoris]|uniref:class 1b ribonucleoside-diphosphate reductase subunit alpha n=1 Tax=Lactococcus lactis subsp. cremoris TaxID=1359 RepID=UPI000582CCD8|nr:class 1b ribonucleoside-diphosphate reductase subunit alpha [Lactococcus cremoris]KGH33618.1 ribonucleotide-diphosphate reductase subunit alpha [Lactococcus cremoris]QSE64700.1 class 1b ribonucleoside-diphosphate reductase subunit alpha [Lactococcus cremoris]